MTVLFKHIEFGQGPLTGLATLVAEELDADWSQMQAEHAPPNPELYKNSLFGMQGTGGSTAIANSYRTDAHGRRDRARHAGEAAANAGACRPREITVEHGVMRHARSEAEGRFGQFADAAAKLPVPKPRFR